MMREHDVAGIPLKTFTCPTCFVTFSASDSYSSDGRGKGKKCPSGHFHTYSKIYSSSKSANADKCKTSQPIKPKHETLKSLGLGPQEAYQLAAANLLASYDRLVATSPPGVLLLVEGAFGKTPELARRILNAP